MFIFFSWVIPELSCVLFNTWNRRDVIKLWYDVDIYLETVNKIAEINPDFSNFLKQVRNDISIREIRKEKYDKIKHFEELFK